jgi:hypothetical protein
MNSTSLAWQQQQQQHSTKTSKSLVVHIQAAALCVQGHVRMPVVQVSIIMGICPCAALTHSLVIASRGVLFDNMAYCVLLLLT